MYDKTLPMPTHELLSCISVNIKLNADDFPVTSSWQSKKDPIKIEYARDVYVRIFENFLSLPISHANKPNEILKRIADKIGKNKPFSTTKLDRADLLRLQIADEDEGLVWLNQLKMNELIRWSNDGSGLYQLLFKITPSGWARVEELTYSANSTDGFIAMSFGYKERSQLESTIVSACDAAGWKALTIDRHEYVGGVVDAIVARINTSRFVVADLTEHKHGVYFEAGYALGKGIQVIFTIKDTPEEKEKVHFDVQHLNQIRWRDYDDLKTKLINRLNAILRK